MRVWLISLFGLLIFIVSGLMVQKYLDNSANDLNQKLAKIEPALAARNWDQSLSRLNSAKTTWNKTKPFWAVLTRHNEIDTIEQTIEMTTKAISIRNFTDAWEQLGVLRLLVKHIPERERFSLENIF